MEMRSAQGVFKEVPYEKSNNKFNSIFYINLTDSM